MTTIRTILGIIDGLIVLCSVVAFFFGDIDMAIYAILLAVWMNLCVTGGDLRRLLERFDA